ncbi:outer membrane protein OmpK [Marinobacterium mangrovicola]|uniref:Nucleoside-specific outer membrane channel protein Tsx n=1 Tax=Marinobacterium mangrovicola TaxID=1476959 RepID=A0A4R1GJW3_9GAMM|nr:outer membrane protein OmpK [Marinobacterium mangrovicola]TCK07490.1 nucleoside-specific outer membrane channel protein Tsx [Marinobacterium mangrovicola]
MKIKTTAGCLLTGALICSPASAEQLWSTFSLTYLNGSEYEVGDDDRQVITVEHASAHSWGDNFFFLDRLKSDNGYTENYMELSPRLSLVNLTGRDLSFGPVKDLLLSATWESGEGFDDYLAGIGISLDVPGFRYFNANLYHVNNENKDDDQQLTLTWGLPFELGSAEFLYDGFLDWSTSESDHAAEMNFTSQLKWNVGKLFDARAPVYVGVEYAHWNNKFGIDGIDERNPSFLLKWHF